VRSTNDVSVGSEERIVNNTTNLTMSVPALPLLPAGYIPTIDLSTLQQHLADDVSLINNIDPNYWIPYLKEDNNKDECFLYKAKDDNGCWLKLVGEILEGDLANVDDLLCWSLPERLHDWQDSLVNGSVLYTYSIDPLCELHYYRYRSHILMCSPTETLYTTLRQEKRSSDNQQLISIVLSNRSIDDVNGKRIQQAAGYERIQLQSCYLISRRPSDPSHGFLYRYIQHVSSQQLIRDPFSHKSQAEALMTEIHKIRKAMKKPVNGLRSCRRREGKEGETKGAVDIVRSELGQSDHPLVPSGVNLKNLADPDTEPSVEAVVNLTTETGPDAGPPQA